MGLLNLTSYKPSAGTSGDAAQIANGFTAIEVVVNALVNANVDAAAAIDVSKLAAGTNGQVLTTTGGVPTWGAANTLPSGVIFPYGASTAPTGYLLCDGSLVSRTTYAALFAVISTGYGVGDGSTTFGLPDLRGRVPVGVGTNASVNALNANDGVAVANRRPQHRHTAHNHVTNALGNAVNGGAVLALANGATSEYLATNTSADGGSGAATDSLDAPAFVVVQYIIKT